MEHPTLSQVTSTSTNVIKFTLPEPPTWMQMAKRLHDDGREEFRYVCHIAKICAQDIVMPNDRSFFALVDRMKIVETDSSRLEFAIREITAEYNKAYSISNQEDAGPLDLAEVIPFPGNKQEVAQ